MADVTEQTPTAAPVVSNGTQQPRVTLYWLEQSRSQRVLWLLEELNIPYDLKIYHRDPKTRLAPPELMEIHPLGKSPVISVTAPGSDKPVVIAESAFIIEYLLDHWGSSSTLLPKRWEAGQEGKIGGETEEWRRFRYYMHYAEGSLMTLMLLGLVALNIKTSSVPFFIKPITSGISNKIQESFLQPNFKKHFAFLESQLDTSGGDYLCGKNLTGADILLSFPLIAGKTRAGLTVDKYPKLIAYTERLENQPGYKKAADKIIEIDGKFDASF